MAEVAGLRSWCISVHVYINIHLQIMASPCHYYSKFYATSLETWIADVSWLCVGTCWNTAFDDLATAVIIEILEHLEH